MPLRDGDRHALVLRAWEAINTERDLHTVLVTVADLLEPLVTFDAVSLIGFEEGKGGRPYAFHLVGEPPEAAAMVLTTMKRPLEGAADRPLRPHAGSVLAARVRSGQTYTCVDLLAEPAWYPHERRLAAAGIRAYASIPLLARGALIGVAVFARRAPRGFTDMELAVLQDVARAMGVATANAMANDEIRRLRDQLEAENVALRSELSRTQAFGEVIGRSEGIRVVLDALDQVAPTDLPVLITGETGTGKELVARAVHRRSARSDRALVKVRCAGVSAGRIAAELLEEKGQTAAVTDAEDPGQLGAARGGTLLLDEVADLPPDAQQQVVRLLETGDQPGARSSAEKRVRLIATSSRDLVDAVRSGRLRSDLYYRLSVFPLHLPPLRARREDLPLLVAHFASRYGAQFGRKVDRVERRTLRLFESHTWPGNVRELENVISRAVLLSRTGVLRFDRRVLQGAAVADNLGDELRNRERDAIEAALALSGGRVSGPSGAAVRLGLPASTLEFRIRRLGIDKFRYRRFQDG